MLGNKGFKKIWSKYYLFKKSIFFFEKCSKILSKKFLKTSRKRTEKYLIKNKIN